MAGVIIYSNNTALALELLTAARLIGQEVKALSINNEQQAQVLKEAGANVYKAAEACSVADTNAVADILKQAAEALKADIILLSSDRRGKELSGRLAQKLKAGCLTDIKAITVNGTEMECERNALGGAAVSVQFIKSEKQVLAISAKVFMAADATDGGSINNFSAEEIKSLVHVKETINKGTDSVDIADAEVLVAVGCGVQKESNLPAVEAIAEALGGLVGCSKPVATDWKWFSEERIIGLSGKICSPEVALTLGVSGQVQFTVGIRGARVLISINRDENAPLNNMADYYMIADLNDILPQLKDALN